MSKIPLIVIQGPTAVGKSKLALRLAEEIGTSIISADSRQVYKYLNIGTAKPTREEQARIDHYLIDIIEPDQVYSAGAFSEDASQFITELTASNKIPIICGGTGFYISVLLDGIFKSPDIPRDIRLNIRNSIKTKGVQYLYERLKKIDPESAERVNENDANRIARALEIYEASGKTITELWQKNEQERTNYNTLNIMVTEDRKTLYDKINERVDVMFEMGLLNEMKMLINKGYSKNDPGMNTVGYKELIPFFDGELDLEECKDKIKKNTRNYAKRQFTWYRKIDFDLTLDSKSINFSDVLKEISKLRERQ